MHAGHIDARETAKSPIKKKCVLSLYKIDTFITQGAQTAK